MGDSLWNYMWMLKSHGIFKQHLSPHLMLILKIKLSLSWKRALKSSRYHLEKPWVAPERKTSLFIRQKHWLCLSYHLVSPTHPWKLSRPHNLHTSWWSHILGVRDQVTLSQREATFEICWHRWGGLSSSSSHHKGCFDEWLSLDFFSWISPRIMYLKIIGYLLMLHLLY